MLNEILSVCRYVYDVRQKKFLLAIFIRSDKTKPFLFSCTSDAKINDWVSYLSSRCIKNSATDTDVHHCLLTNNDGNTFIGLIAGPSVKHIKQISKLIAYHLKVIVLFKKIALFLRWSFLFS